MLVKGDTALETRRARRATYRSEEAMALYRTMAASPDDAAPRLVFADWLEERGHTAAAHNLRAK